MKRVVVPVPTLAGWIVIGALVAAAAAAFVLGVHPFLAVHAPTHGDILVVEGWLDRAELQYGVSTFLDGDYGEIVATGVPLEADTYLALLYPGCRTHADIAATQFREQGLDSSRVHAVPAQNVPRDRTYTSGLALRRWLTERGRRGVRLDVLTRGSHARRTWMLFSRALDGVAEVGVVSLEPAGYDRHRWWKTGNGARTVLSEIIAYGYAKFLFFPEGDATAN